MTTGSDLVTYAKTHLGAPYVFGAEGPNAYDCSGLVQEVFGHFGIKLPRLAHDQAEQGTEVKRGGEQPGDLVFSSWDGRQHSHVGIYAGGNQIVVAPHSGDVVKMQTLTDSYWKHVDGIRRISGLSGSGSTTKSVLGADFEKTGIVDDVTGALGSLNRLADWLLKLSIPSNATRFVCGIAGVFLLFVGLWHIGHELKD